MNKPLQRNDVAYLESAKQFVKYVETDEADGWGEGNAGWRNKYVE